MFSWKKLPAPLVALLLRLHLLQPPLPQARPPHPVLRPLLHLLQTARTTRAVGELLAVAVHYPLAMTEREALLMAATAAVQRVPSGIAFQKSSRSKRKMAHSTTTRPLRK